MATKLESRSPLDDAVIWQGEHFSARKVADSVRRASLAQRAWREKPLPERIQVVERYGEYLRTHQEELTDLLAREVGKLPWDAAGEVRASIAKASVSIQALHDRRGHQVVQSRSDENPVQRVIRYHAIGTVLVLGPFNFPLHLPGGQIIPALLAGNSVVFKPSDQAPAVGQWIGNAWHEVGLPEGVLEVIQGGVETAVAAIDCDEVDGVFLTGGRNAGRAIHRQLAGRPSVLLALELGGNNPIVVCENVDEETATGIVSFSAFISAGQRCTCSRRAIFIGEKADSHIESLVDRIGGLRVGLPDDDPAPQIGPIISEDAAIGLKQTFEKLVELGCEPIIPLETDSRRPNLVRPSLLDASGLSNDQLHELGELEWFGPMLVVQRAPSFDEALHYAGDTAYGLAAALLGGDQALFDRFVANVGAGVVNWNGPTTGAAGTLPFGGLGESGNHRPAGYFAIDFCNDPVASLEREQPATDDPWKIAK